MESLNYDVYEGVEMMKYVLQVQVVPHFVLLQTSYPHTLTPSHHQSFRDKWGENPCAREVLSIFIC